ncbi:MAG: PIG-L family deacetylase [Acidimicrobiales bacterium]|nr:PIG-L family deacetylase [Acidimicrobiales bacterium]
MALPGIRTWNEPTPARVLAIYAHPDDPDVSCGGTLARWASEGSQVRILICTRGEKGSQDPDTDPDTLASRRATEVADSARILGVAGHEILGYGDGELVNDAELRERLVERIRSFRPDVVVAPDPTAVFFGSSYVNHHDHRELGFAVLDACYPAAYSPLYFPAAGSPHRVHAIFLSGTLEPDTAVDVSGSLECKIRALTAHESQLRADAHVIGEALRERAADAGARAGMEFAEEFRVIRVVA